MLKVWMEFDKNTVRDMIDLLGCLLAVLSDEHIAKMYSDFKPLLTQMTEICNYSTTNEMINELIKKYFQTAV